MPKYTVNQGHKLALNDRDAVAGDEVELPAEVAAQYAVALTPVDEGAQPQAAPHVEQQA